MNEMTLKLAVELFGTKAQKRCIAEGKKWRKESNDSLIKTLEQHFESVEQEGKGKKKIFILGKKRDEIAERKRNLGGNISNGSWSNPYTKNLDIIVVSHLENKKVITGAQTLNKWCLDFGLISHEMYQLIISKHNEKSKSNFVKKLKENNVIEKGQERIIDDYIDTFQGLQGQLVSTLRRMEKLNIIEYYPVIKAVLKNGKVINLHESIHELLLSEKRKLMEKYDVTDWYINTFRNAKKTINYKEEWSNTLENVVDLEGNSLNIEYFYTAYAIILKATEKRIINYLSKFNKEVIEEFKKKPELFLKDNKETFHCERKGFIYDKAEEKTDAFLNGKVAPKKVKSLQKKLGGIENAFYKPDINNYTFDEEYYRLFFEGLYAQKIKELQEHYNFNFIEIENSATSSNQ